MNDKRKIIAIFIIVAIVAALAAVATFFVIKSAKNEAKGSSQMTETATEDSSDKDDLFGNPVESGGYKLAGEIHGLSPVPFPV